VGTESKRGTGLGIGGSYKLTGDDLLMAQWARVDGDYDMMYGSTGYGLDGSGKVIFDKNDGLVLGWAHTFSDKLRGNVALGFNRSKADATYVAQSASFFGVEQVKRLTQLHVGAIYSPIKNVELGAEYVYGQRKFFSVADGGSGSPDGKLSRFDLMGRYSF
jgi:hypothetical protein